MSQEPISDNQTSQKTFQAIVPSTSQQITTSGSSALSNAFGGQTTLVRLFCTQDCYVAFGANPTANTSTSMFLPGGIIEYYGVSPLTKLAVIQKTAAGVLYCTEGL